MRHREKHLTMQQKMHNVAELALGRSGKLERALEERMGKGGFGKTGSAGVFLSPFQLFHCCVIEQVLLQVQIP